MIAFGLMPFVWGFCEATFFFIVPDVWLTWLAFARYDRAKVGMAVLWALLGAILGGILMYTVGSWATLSQIVRWLDHVPAISPSLIERVSVQIADQGITSLFIGIPLGIPYKIYASLWGSNHGHLGVFLFVSVLARGGRFLFSVCAARIVDLLAKKLFVQWGTYKHIVFGVLWTAFYIFYFYSRRG